MNFLVSMAADRRGEAGTGWGGIMPTVLVFDSRVLMVLHIIQVFYNAPTALLGD